MKEIKVQQDILALANTPNRVKFGELNNGRKGVTIDGCAVYIFNIGNLLLDTTKFLTFGLQKICDDVFNAKDIFPTGVSINDGKTTLKEFKNDETTAYFNEKLLKYFDNKMLSFSYHKNKLFVCENGELSGIVLETRVKK